jgi:hypothetical protein
LRRIKANLSLKQSFFCLLGVLRAGKNVMALVNNELLESKMLEIEQARS